METIFEADYTVDKPLARVYKWLGFVTFWGALILGLVEIVRWVVWANEYVSINTAL